MSDLPHELEAVDLPEATNDGEINNSTVDDDMAEIFKEVGPPETKEEPDPNDPLNKVKTSASRLATSLGLLTRDIDSKLGISTTAKKIDDQVHVTERTKQAFGVVAATATSLDEKFHVSEKTKNTANAVTSNSAVEGIKTSVGGVLQGAGNEWKKFDERHALSSKTANFMSSTADFLSNKINPAPAASVSKPDQDLADALKETDDDGKNFPSSFQN